MIYFLQAVSGPIKIGYSADPDFRLSSMQTSFYEDVALIAITEGDREAEHALHDRFEADKIRREWYRPSPTLLGFIERLPPYAGGRSRDQRTPSAFSIRLPQDQPGITDKPLAEGELKAWRESLGCSQKDVADWMGVSLRTYENWEQGVRSVRHPLLVRSMMAEAQNRDRTTGLLT